MASTRRGPDTSPPAPGGVVCGIDGSAAAGAAAWAAARAAELSGLGLRLVRAFDWPADGVPGLPPGDAGRSAARRSALGDLSRLADELQVAHPGVAVAGMLTDGPAPTVLTAASSGASLLVVGARGQSPLGGPRLGSVATGLTRTTHCPLLVHRGHGPGDARAGVVAVVDGGRGTDELLALAARATPEGGRLTVVHGGSGPVGDTCSGVGTAVEAMRLARPGLRIEQRADRGPPGALLLELAAEASLLVVAAGDGGSATALRLGHGSVLVAPVPG